ncbi:hypothetical protein NP233_g105 [Leucocoprinus birnbaumii]|uniref:RNA-directed DNA polymerase n=1 Tax=Leucocoprinus birnbaumii TaxID=56174 RepID=A0AAD5YWY8_9AGAR|nr:hypothetical protein NP233_g105 [Leucocoprinus birnbaumii]
MGFSAALNGLLGSTAALQATPGSTAVTECIDKQSGEESSINKGRPSSTPSFTLTSLLSKAKAQDTQAEPESSSSSTGHSEATTLSFARTSLLGGPEPSGELPDTFPFKSGAASSLNAGFASSSSSSTFGRPSLLDDEQQLPWNATPADSVQATSFSGKTILFKKRKRTQRSAVPTTTPTSADQFSNLLDVPVHRLLDDLSASMARSLQEGSARIADGSPVESTDDTLWVDRYRPTCFTDLIGNDRVARETMAWIKQWDFCVFGKKKGKKRQRTGDENSNPDDEYHRPREKILLLSGPPGLGKTTLAHIVARHAGYDVLEINASDARGGNVVDDRIRPTLESGSLVNSTKPVCLVIDEIDGATGAGENTNSFIHNLVQLTQGKWRKKKRGGQKQQPNSQRPLLRPIICICNDINASSLAKLRPHAYLVRFVRPADFHTVRRLQEICDNEDLKAETRALNTLVAMAKGDLRGCINTLQFVKSRREDVTEAVIRKATAGMKEGDTTIIAVLNSIFSPMTKKRVKELGMTEEQESRYVNRLSHEIEGSGKDAAIANGCFEHYATLRQYDANFSRHEKAAEWLITYDALSSSMFTDGEFALLPYLPFTLVPFYPLFQARNVERIERNYSDWEHHQLTKSNEEIYLSFARCLRNATLRQEGGAYRHLVSTPILQLEFTPFINRIISPPLRPVNSQVIRAEERHLLARLDGQLSYGLDPPIDVFVTYDGKRAGDMAPSRYAVRHLVATEVDAKLAARDVEGVERAKATKRHVFEQVQNNEANKPSGVDTSEPAQKRQKTNQPEISEKTPTDFFGRPITVKSTINSKSAAKKQVKEPYHLLPLLDEVSLRANIRQRQRCHARHFSSPEGASLVEDLHLSLSLPPSPSFIPEDLPPPDVATTSSLSSIPTDLDVSPSPLPTPAVASHLPLSDPPTEPPLETRPASVSPWISNSVEVRRKVSVPPAVSSSIPAPVKLRKKVSFDDDFDDACFSADDMLNDKDTVVSPPAPFAEDHYDAQVKQVHPGMPPIFGNGRPTIAAFGSFQRGCIRYFKAQSVESTEQIDRVIDNFDHPSIEDYIATHRDELLDLVDFPAFIARMKDTFLEKGWEILYMAEVRSHQGDMRFKTWVDNICTANHYLLGTGLEMSNKMLRDHIRATWRIEMHAKYEDYKLTKDLNLVPDFEPWLKEVSSLATAVERSIRSDRPALADRLSDSFSTSTRRIGPRVSSAPAPSPARSNVPVTVANAKRIGLSMTQIYDALVSWGFPRPPDFDVNVREFLRKHFGCFLCRMLYANHKSTDCVLETNLKESNWYPPKTEEELSCMRAQFEARKRMNAAPTILEYRLTDMPLEDVLEEYNDSEILDGSTPSPVVHAATAYIEADTAFKSDTLQTNAAFIQAPPADPLFTAAVLYDDERPVASDAMALDDNEISLDSHLWWNCVVDGPRFDSLPAKALIDHGCPTALISDELASRLSLRRFPLCNTLSLGGVSGGKKSITHSVRLHVHDPSSLWSACVTNAYIVPDFKFDMILGLDWLRANKIVVDMDLGSVTAKDSGFDLLHPSPPPQPRPLPCPLSPRRRKVLDFAAAREAMSVVLAELSVALETDAERRMELEAADAQLKAEYADLFPATLPHVNTLPDDVHHRIVVTAAEKICVTREYSCPRKWQDSWRKLIDEHISAGRIRPSSSPYAAPSLISKADPSALPQWVIDYRRLNLYTVPNRMHPDDIKYTACRTPFGLYEWTVMPMGLRNSPSTQQRRVTAALQHLIGKICYVYLDDIIIWSNSLEEHFRNVRKVLDALRAANLLCSIKKSTLFCDEVIFLGHRISRRGIEADPSKVSRILSWPTPRSASDVRRFLGLVKFIAHFLPDLASFTNVLYPLTTKSCDKLFPPWEPRHADAFQNIKRLVTSSRCLTSIDHDSPGDNRIFITCDASLKGTGAVLSWGPSWKDSRPVAFDSQIYHGPERHYPTHEQELLAIIWALKKWCSDLIGMHFEIFTDHKTLLNFDAQKDLSRRQAHWMEFLSQYDYKINYINGSLNVAADALSRLGPMDPPSSVVLAAASFLSEDPPPDDSSRLALDSDDLALFCLPSVSSDLPHFHFLAASARLLLKQQWSGEHSDNEFRAGYESDPFAKKLISSIDRGSHHNLNLSRENGLLLVKKRLYVPHFANLRERLFFLAHDQLGHLGFDKSYANLRDSFFWPNMRSELERAYIPGCEQCQRNKSTTHRRPGPLHPLPVPDSRFASVAIDFVSPLPLNSGFNYLATITDCLGTDVKLVLCRDDMSAEDFAQLFLDHWYCNNGCPAEVVSDRDRLFTSRFWDTFTSLLNIKRLMSTSFHPETDGASERTNKTVVQCLHFFIERNQSGWVRALPRVRFNIMNSVNASTGLSGFQLKTGHAPRLLPLNVTLPVSLDTAAGERSLALVNEVNSHCAEAQDNLLAAKITQAYYANEYRGDDPHFDVGDKVWLNTANRHREFIFGADYGLCEHPVETIQYVMKGSNRVAKFMPRYDGPFQVLKAHPETSSYTLKLPTHSRIHPTFHVSQLKRFVPNDNALFPDRVNEEPGPILTDEGNWEHVVDKIVDKRKRRGRTEFLVRWKGFGVDHDEWLDRSELEDNIALDEWETERLFS